MTTEYWITGTAGDWLHVADWQLGVVPEATDGAAIVAESAPTDDNSASTATTGVVAIGGAATGDIGTTGDASRFKVTLAAGATYQFGLQGSRLSLLDSSGNELIGDYGDGASGSRPGLNDRITYTAPTGTYRLAAQANDGGRAHTRSARPRSRRRRLTATPHRWRRPAWSPSAARPTATSGRPATPTGSRSRLPQARPTVRQGGHSGEGTLQRPVLSLLDSSGNGLIGDIGDGASGSGPAGSNDRITHTAPTLGLPRRPSRRRRRRCKHGQRDRALDDGGAGSHHRGQL